MSLGATKGRGWLIKVDAGSANFVTIGGAQKVSMAVKNEMVDITNADDDGIRTLLEGAGITSVSLSLEGIYLDTDENGQGTLETAALNNTHVTMQVVRPGTSRDGIFQGTFGVAELNYDAEHKDAAKQTMKLESSGEVVFS